MIADRFSILAKPAWRAIGGHPVVRNMDLKTLRAMDGFFDHIARHELSAPGKADFLAWAGLGAGAEGLTGLRDGLSLFDPDDPSLTVIDAAFSIYSAITAHRGTSGKGRRVYERQVSVPPEDLPADWQSFLKTLKTRRIGGDPRAPAPDIQERMAQKLGQYILVLRREGLSEELHQEGLTAFYRDISTRISDRTGAPLRPATLRATFEELERFARLRDTYSENILAALGKTLASLREEEDITAQQKYKKLHGLGGPPDIIRDAFALLHEAGNSGSPAQRHKRRNRAAALGLPAILPLRREWDRIVFGKTLFWEGDRYRFRNYKPGKTALLDNRRDFPASIHPKMTPFIDALVLQDNEPKYIGAFREHVERTWRPLFVNPDGAPCSKNYVTRVWSEIAGTGANIARTMMHDYFGAKGDEGVERAMVICDQYSRQTAEHYRGASIDRRLLDAAQDDILEEFDDLSH